MTKEERDARRQCPFVELIGQQGYICNKQIVSGLKGKKKCFGCKLMYSLTNKKSESMGRVITQERIEKLKEVYSYAKQFPNIMNKEIYEACGLRPTSDGVRFIIMGARNGKSFEASFDDYKANIVRPYRRNNENGSSLDTFTDKQLKDELVRRGWKVKCTRTIEEVL